MKTWTVVVELSNVPRIYLQHGIEAFVTNALHHSLPEEISYRIMETIEAPYGPQHPGGVFITEKKS